MLAMVSYSHLASTINRLQLTDQTGSKDRKAERSHLYYIRI